MINTIILRKNTVKVGVEEFSEINDKVFSIKDLAKKLFHIPNYEKLTEFPPGLIWVSVDNTKYIFQHHSKHVYLMNEDMMEAESYYIKYPLIFFFDVSKSMCQIYNYDHRKYNIESPEELQLNVPIFRNNFVFKGDLNQLIKKYGTTSKFFANLLYDFILVDDYVIENIYEMNPTDFTLHDLVSQYRVEQKTIFTYAEEMINDTAD